MSLSHARIARLGTLLERSMRPPGGAYPAFVLATYIVDPDERRAAEAAIEHSSLAPLWRTWRDHTRTAADRAFALAGFEPAFEHVHLVLADLALRADDAHAEPYPEIRRRLHERNPTLAAAYSRLLGRFAAEFDSDNEYAACRRGFGYTCAETRRLFSDGAEVECFSRGTYAWQPASGGRFAELPIGEIAELEMVHTSEGASATVTAEAYAALECPELLTSLFFRGSLAEAPPDLARAPSLRTLGIPYSRPPAGWPAVDALASLPVEDLVLEIACDSPVTFPPWVCDLPRLRTLRIDYPKGATDDGDVDVPAEITRLNRLEALALSGVRSLPDALDRMSALRVLSVRGWHFVAMPPSISRLENLESMTIDPAFSLSGVPDDFDRLRALRSVRLGHLTTARIPPPLLRMPWLRNVELISARRWPATEEAGLRAALRPDARVFVAFTGNARQDPSTPGG